MCSDTYLLLPVTCRGLSLDQKYVGGKKKFTTNIKCVLRLRSDLTFLGENTKFLSVAIKTHQNKLKNHTSKFFSDLE